MPQPLMPEYVTMPPNPRVKSLFAWIDSCCKSFICKGLGQSETFPKGTKEELAELAVQRVLQRNIESLERNAIEAEHLFNPRYKLSRDLQPDGDCYPYG